MSINRFVIGCLHRNLVSSSSAVVMVSENVSYAMGRACWLVSFHW